MYPYALKSESGTAVAQALGVMKIKHENSVFRGKEGRKVINWGNSRLKNQEVGKCTVLNSTEAVADSIDKRACLELLDSAGCGVPEHTTLHRIAERWLKQGHTVVARTEVDGHDGSGVVLVHPGEELPRSPLYTKYFEGAKEYRVHYVKGSEFFYQDRVKKRDWNDPLNDSKEIRTSSQGYGFNPIQDVPPSVITNASIAFDSLGLDFGAADIRYDADTGNSVVLEVNTAPEVFGVTLNKYKAAFEKLLDN